MPSAALRPSGQSPVHPARIRALNDAPVRGGGDVRYVLYWMQQSQRAEGNDALEHAVALANAADLPLVVGFGLMDDYPEATARPYRFMLEGLLDTATTLAGRGIPFVLRRQPPDVAALDLARHAARVVCDRGYLRHQRRWRVRVSSEAPCSVVQVESDVVVPVDVASDKREFAARTLRPKIVARMEPFLRLSPELALGSPMARAQSRALTTGPDTLDHRDVDGTMAALKLDRTVAPVPHLFRGGLRQARARLSAFVGDGLSRYVQQRPRVEAPSVSHLSMHLHFGQISPVEIALAARSARVADDDRASFLEELIVRRELAQNYVAFTEDYDQFQALPDWARVTLGQHASDPRKPSYTAAQLDAGATHDPAWNAAMQEMKHTGYLPNAMRMYWGKQILAWVPDPEEAFRVALALNNRYLLDGRDANSYANIAWIFGLHDRPFAERPVFGKVRTMTASGLDRKADVPGYLRRVDDLVRDARSHGVWFD